MKRKIDIYAGLLGCGKTTLIRRLLQTEYQGKKVAIIENEIGKVNLDGLAVQAAGVTVREMTSGCVCCTIQGEFTRAIDLLVMEVDPEIIIIEPTGAADLAGLIDACKRSKRAELRRIIMLVNAKKLAHLLSVVGNFYRDQIRLASCIYLNFTETMDPAGINKGKILLDEIHKGVPIVDTPLESITDQTFAGVYISEDAVPAKDEREKNANLIVADLNKTEAIHILPQVKQANLYTYTLQVPTPISDNGYEKLKEILTDEIHQKIWRAKGLVRLQSGEMRKVDLTFGDVFEEKIPETITKLVDEKNVLGQIVLIGTSIDKVWLKYACNNLIAEEKEGRCPVDE